MAKLRKKLRITHFILLFFYCTVDGLRPGGPCSDEAYMNKKSLILFLSVIIILRLLNMELANDIRVFILINY